MYVVGGGRGEEHGDAAEASGRPHRPAGILPRMAALGTAARALERGADRALAARIADIEHIRSARDVPSWRCSRWQLFRGPRRSRAPSAAFDARHPRAITQPATA